MAEITPHHREALAAYKVAKDKLSPELQKEYADVEKAFAAFLQNPIDEKLKTSAEHASAKLGHKIMDFVEATFPEKKKDEPKAQEPAKTETPKVENVAPAQNATPPTQTPETTTVTPPASTETQTQQTVAPVAAEQKETGGNVEAKKEDGGLFGSGGLFNFFK